MGIIFCGCIKVRDDDSDEIPINARTSFKEEVVQRQSELISSSVKSNSSCSKPSSSAVCLVEPSAPKFCGYFPEEFPSSDVADECLKHGLECPTCLEEYDAENPMIVTQCLHHFHLGCIYSWMERSDTCPICNRVMEFQEMAWPWA